MHKKTWGGLPSVGQHATWQSNVFSLFWMTALPILCVLSVLQMRTWLCAGNRSQAWCVRALCWGLRSPSWTAAVCTGRAGGWSAPSAPPLTLVKYMCHLIESGFCLKIKFSPEFLHSFLHENFILRLFENSFHMYKVYHFGDNDIAVSCAEDYASMCSSFLPPLFPDSFPDSPGQEPGLRPGTGRGAAGGGGGGGECKQASALIVWYRSPTFVCVFLLLFSSLSFSILPSLRCRRLSTGCGSWAGLHWRRLWRLLSSRGQQIRLQREATYQPRLASWSLPQARIRVRTPLQPRPEIKTPDLFSILWNVTNNKKYIFCIWKLG